jgi:hypothetical protein
MKWKSNCADGIDFSFFSSLLLLFSHARIHGSFLCSPICFTRELMMETEWGMKFLSCLYEKWMKVFPWEIFSHESFSSRFELARFTLGSVYALFGRAFKRIFVYNRHMWAVEFTEMKDLWVSLQKKTWKRVSEIFKASL